MISVVLLAYFTGGATKSYTHLIYIPILLSAYFWTIKGGTIAALLSGVLIGPLLPLNVAEGIMQTEGNWIIRLVVLTIVGFVAGGMFHKVNKLNEQAKERDYINPLTGTYNTNKLVNHLEERMNKGGNLCCFFN